jgi:hypothetical protein
MINDWRVLIIATYCFPYKLHQIQIRNFNPGNSPGKFRSTINIELDMRLIYKSTGAPVEIGDVVTMGGDQCTVVGIDKPKSPVGNGRVNCRKGYGIYSWFPSLIGAIWEFEDGTRTGFIFSQNAD